MNYDGPRYSHSAAKDRIKALEAERDTLLARVRELEAGMRPFARMAVSAIRQRDDDWQILIPETEPQPTFGMFETARVLLPNPSGDRK